MPIEAYFEKNIMIKALNQPKGIALKIFILIFFVFFSDRFSIAQTYKVGDEIKDFSLRNISGKLYSLGSFPSAKGFILVFTSNYCPFSKSYEDRLVATERRFTSQSYPMILINPNDPEAYQEDNQENISARAKEKGWVFPILRDEKQALARAFGVTRLPQVFVIQKTGNKYFLKYSGAIDDNPQDAAGISTTYLDDAVKSLLDNKPIIVSQTKPVGCAIRWKPQ